MGRAEATCRALGARNAGVLVDLDDMPAGAGSDSLELTALVVGGLPRRADSQTDTSGQRGAELTAVAVCTGLSLRQSRAASISASVAPLLRAQASAAGAEYFAT
jgi:hypothetical protein